MHDYYSTFWLTDARKRFEKGQADVKYPRHTDETHHRTLGYYLWALPDGIEQEARDSRFRSVTKDYERALEDVDREMIAEKLRVPADMNAQWPQFAILMWLYGFDSKEFSDLVNRAKLLRRSLRRLRSARYLR